MSTFPMIRSSQPRASRGFTLIEMLVTVAIVAILAAIAYPSYNRQVQKARRADGREMLMRVAAAQERYYTNHNAYAATLTDLGLASGQSESGYYLIDIDALAAGATLPQTFGLTATPQNAQATDACANLLLNNAGLRDKSGTDSNGPCW